MAFAHKFSSSPTPTRWPIQTVYWEWSLAIAEKCPGIVWERAGCHGTNLCQGLHWQSSSGVMLCQYLGPCPGPLWLPSADRPYVSDSRPHPTVPSALPWILGLNSCFICLSQNSIARIWTAFWSGSDHPAHCWLLDEQRETCSPLARWEAQGCMLGWTVREE